MILFIRQSWPLETGNYAPRRQQSRETLVLSIIAGLPLVALKKARTRRLVILRSSLPIAPTQGRSNAPLSKLPAT